MITLNEKSFVHCAKCGFAVSFLQGQENKPQTGVIEVMPETVITLVCPIDGKFEVTAEEFQDPPPEPQTQP
jgi:hypothetical protein